MSWPERMTQLDHGQRPTPPEAQGEYAVSKTKG